MKKARHALWLGMLLVVVSLTAHAQSSVTPEDEYKQLIKVDQDIQPLGANPFGENVDLYDGTLSFEVTDVSLPGTGPVLQLSRSLQTTNSLSYAPDALRPFGDWDLDIPRIETNTADQENDLGWQTVNSPTARCSYFNAPPSVSPSQPGGDPWSPNQWWYGYHLIIPGQGSQELLARGTVNTLSPSMSGLSFPIVTKQNWMIHCGVTASDGGEGFVAIAPDGTQYTFAYLIYRPMAYMTSPLGTSPDSVSAGGAQPMLATDNILTRRDALMMVTKIEDRFGNTLTYNYSGNNLVSIVASDGRQVTLSYYPAPNANLVQFVTEQPTNAAPRTWGYSYNTSNPALPSLTSVLLPDNVSKWTYNLGAFQTAPIITTGGNCTDNTFAIMSENVAIGTITHPSGLTGTFTLQAMMHGRSYVPKSCYGPAGSASDYPYANIPEVSYQLSLTSKVFTGAGLSSPETWTYGYSAANESWSSDACATAGTCPTTIYTDVLDPEGEDVRSTFSNRFDATEGQLLSTTYYAGAAGSTILRTVANTYANPTGGPWPTAMGVDLVTNDNRLQTTELSPVGQRTTTEEGDTYIWQAEAFNAYAQPTDVKRFNSIAGQTPIEETTTYLNDPALWVLGLPEQVTNVTAGETESVNTYNPSGDTLLSRSRFGETLMNYTFNSAGQLASFTDGDSHTTSLSNYYRGIPESISYPDGTSESLAVDDFGQITSITDQAKNVTSYRYNSVGRLDLITYPTDDSVAWLSENIGYNLIASAERGIGAVHWDRTTTVGSAVTTTYFDAMLRPVLSDTSIPGSSDITTIYCYDSKGQTTFTSYAVAGSPNYSCSTSGITNTYDALGRLTVTSQNSELGLLTTTINYLAGAQKQVIVPGNHSTFTNYQVFDEPSYNAPILVVPPPVSGITQSITRDLYGNPLSITQSGLYNGTENSVTKNLYYDSYHRLCLTNEPESGSEAMGYDGANNLLWSASGLSLTGGCAASGQVAAAATTNFTYDPMNRVLTIVPPAGTQSTAYTYDPLGHVATAVSGIASQGYQYDTRGLLTSETLTIPSSGFSWGIGYTYDAYAHLSAIGYPAGTGVSEGVAYAPDVLGRPTQVGSYASGITYWPNGQVASFTYGYGNGTSYLSDQNTRQLPSSFSYGTASTLNVSEDLGYDSDGNILNVTDLDGGTRTKTFTYDGFNRLLTAAAPGLSINEAYTYDALNNLRTVQTAGQTNTYTYNTLNQLASIANGTGTIDTFGYDNYGNQTSKNGNSLLFDQKNQLTQIPNYDSYAYDAAGRRVMKSPAAGGPPTYYLYDQSGQLMYSYASGAAQSTNYIYLGTKLIARDTSLQLAEPGAISFSANPNNGSYTVSWGAVLDATSYTLEESVNGGAWTAVYAGSGTSTTLSGRAGGSYIYQVQGCSTSCGPWVSSATLGVWPALPVITVPSGTINGTYTVSWTASVSATGYDVQESLNGGAWTTIASNTTATSISRPGTTTGSYTYQVSASNVYGSQGWAESGAVTVNTTYGVVPTAPAGFTVPAASNNGAASLSWGAATLATTYVVQQSSDGGNTWGTVYNSTGTGTSLSGLADGSYTYQLQACNTYGCSAWVAGGPLVVTYPPTTAPVLTTPAASATGSYTVSWSGVDGQVSYTLQEQINGGAWSAIQTNALTSWSASAQTDGTYGYEVQACNAGGCGPWSNISSTVVTYPPTAAPTQTVPASSSTGSYTVSWTAVSAATTYTLQQSISGGAWTTLQSSSALSRAISGEGNGSYGYRVQGCNVGGCGPWSGTGSITVALVPVMPAGPLHIVVAGTPTKPEVEMTWAIATATSYTMQAYEPTGDEAWVTMYSGSGTTWEGTVLYTGEIEYRLQACNSEGCSAWSTPQDEYFSSGIGG